LNIKVGQRERDEEKVSRYINSLRYDIQDEINIVIVRAVEDAYKIALKVEEMLDRKQSQQNIGRSLNIGRGVS
jgi:hypothetical protein